MELTSTFTELLVVFRPVFTAPSYDTFRLLMTGWIVSVRHRYVTDLIISSDSVGNGHFSDYHRFFSQAVWNIDHLWKLLATLIVNLLIGKDAAIILAGDDTLCRKRGLGIFARRNAPRPVEFIEVQEDLSLGTRLGRFVHRDFQAVVGAEQGVRVADLHASLPKSARAYQGQTQGDQEGDRQPNQSCFAAGQAGRQGEKESSEERQGESQSR